MAVRIEILIVLFIQQVGYIETVTVLPEEREILFITVSLVRGSVRAMQANNQNFFHGRLTLGESKSFRCYQLIKTIKIDALACMH